MYNQTKSGENNTKCSIVKHDIGGKKEARYSEGHGKSGDYWAMCNKTTEH